MSNEMKASARTACMQTIKHEIQRAKKGLVSVVFVGDYFRELVGNRFCLARTERIHRDLVVSEIRPTLASEFRHTKM